MICGMKQKMCLVWPPFLLVTLCLAILSGCACGGAANNDIAIGLCELATEF